MRRLVVLFLGIHCSLSAQSWQSAALNSTPGDVNEIVGTVADAEGNIYMAGNFKPLFHKQGPSGIFLSRYDRNGLVSWTDTLLTDAIDLKTIFINNDKRICLAGELLGSTFFFGFHLNQSATGNHLNGFAGEFNEDGSCASVSNLSYVPYTMQEMADGSYAVMGKCFREAGGRNFSSETGYFVGTLNDLSDARWLQPAPAYSYRHPLLAMDGHGNIYFTERNRNELFLYNGTSSRIICDHNNISAITADDDNIYFFSSDSAGHIFSYKDQKMLWEKRLQSPAVASHMIIRNGRLILYGTYEYQLIYNGGQLTGQRRGKGLYVLETDKLGNGVQLITSPDSGADGELQSADLFLFNDRVVITGMLEGQLLLGKQVLNAGMEDHISDYIAVADWKAKPLNSLALYNERAALPGSITDNTVIDLSSFRVAGGISVVMYSASGQLVSMDNTKEKSIRVKKNDLPSGLYYYQVSDNAGELLAEGTLLAQ